MNKFTCKQYEREFDDLSELHNWLVGQPGYSNFTPDGRVALKSLLGYFVAAGLDVDDDCPWDVKLLTEPDAADDLLEFHHTNMGAWIRVDADGHCDVRFCVTDVTVLGDILIRHAKAL